MPLSRQRARRGSCSSGGRKSPNSATNVSDFLSPKAAKREELTPTPSKKRRVDMNQSSADEDDSSTSPLIGKRLWETFESDYKFLMEEDIIRTCRTGDQLDGEQGASSSSTVSLAEFLQQFTELSQWLAKVDARRLQPTNSHARVEKYLGQGFAEELLQKTPRKKLLHDYAQALLERHPEMGEEIRQRLAHLDKQWEAAERQTASLGADEDEELLARMLADIRDDVADLEEWHRDLVSVLPNSNEWMQMMARLTPREVKERQTVLEERQKEIELRSRCISNVLKLVGKLQAGSREAVLARLHEEARQLEDRYHAAWLQSLELLYLTEQWTPPPPANPGAADAECRLAAVVVGGDAFDAAATARAPPGPEVEEKEDVLPFSEDEYESFSAPMRSATPGPTAHQVEDDQRFIQRALYNAELCYEEEDTGGPLARGVALHSRSRREAVIRRETVASRLPGPDNLFLSESELCSVEWRTNDFSDLFGPVSRSADVLLCPDDSETSLETSQVHAVLSVTPRKAYYRMTALDHEMSNDASASKPLRMREAMEEPPSPSPSISPSPDAGETRAPILDLTLRRLGAIGEDEGALGLLPMAHSSPAVLPGQKRRYSRSACALDTVGATGGDRWRREETRESEESAMENRSSSWRELINQLEDDVRRGSGSGGLLLPSSGLGRDDDAGSLADESASSGGGDAALAPVVPSASANGCAGSGRLHASRARRVRRKTSMQLAEQAELIVQPRCRGADSPATDEDEEEEDEEPSHRPLTALDDSLDQAWDNYQAPMYPSAYEDEEEEERLDLCWDEQLEASTDATVLRGPHRRRPRPANDDSTIEALIARSSRLLERARFERAMAPSPERSPRADEGGGEAPSDLEREVARQGEWLATCDSNLSCLDHLKESLADSGVEDDLEPIRLQVEMLLKQWTAFREVTLERLHMIKGLHRIYVEADVVKGDAQRLADLLDAPSEHRFMDNAQMEKFLSTLEFYKSHLPEWHHNVENMHKTLCQSLEQEKVDYLDLRKCYAENLYLLMNWLYSLSTRTDTCLTRVIELRQSYEDLTEGLFNCDRELSNVEHILHCTKFAMEVVDAADLDSTLRDLKVTEARLDALFPRLEDCEKKSAVLSQSFTLDHWQHVDSRLTGLSARLISLKDSCVSLNKSVAALRLNNRPPASSPPHKFPRTAPDSPRIRRAAASWRGRRLWRILRSTLPYQLALLVLFGCLYFLLAEQECAGSSGLLFSPQVRQTFGSPL